MARRWGRALRRRGTRVVQGLALAAASTLLLLLLMEGGMRVWWREPPWERFLLYARFQFSAIPGVLFQNEPCSTCPMMVNEQSYSGPVVQVQPDPQTLRLLIIGDSFCVHAHIGPGERWIDCMGRKLQASLTWPIETVVLATSGHNLDQEVAVLRHRLPRIRGSRVLYAAVPNDFEEMLAVAGRSSPGGPMDLRPVSLVPLRPIGPFRWLPEGLRIGLYRHSYLWQEVTGTLSLQWIGTHSPQAKVPMEVGRPKVLLQEMKQVVEASGGSLAIVAFPFASYTRCLKGAKGEGGRVACAEEEAFFTTLSNAASTLNLPLLDLRKVMRANPDSEFSLGETAPDRIHLGLEGHWLFGEEVARALYQGELGPPLNPIALSGQR